MKSYIKNMGVQMNKNEGIISRAVGLQRTPAKK